MFCLRPAGPAVGPPGGSAAAGSTPGGTPFSAGTAARRRRAGHRHQRRRRPPPHTRHGRPASRIAFAVRYSQDLFIFTIPSPVPPTPLRRHYSPVHYTPSSGSSLGPLLQFQHSFIIRAWAGQFPATILRLRRRDCSQRICSRERFAAGFRLPDIRFGIPPLAAFPAAGPGQHHQLGSPSGSTTLDRPPAWSGRTPHRRFAPPPLPHRVTLPGSPDSRLPGFHFRRAFPVRLAQPGPDQPAPFRSPSGFRAISLPLKHPLPLATISLPPAIRKHSLDLLLYTGQSGRGSFARPLSRFPTPLRYPHSGDAAFATGFYFSSAWAARAFLPGLPGFITAAFGNSRRQDFIDANNYCAARAVPAIRRFPPGFAIIATGLCPPGTNSII